MTWEGPLASSGADEADPLLVEAEPSREEAGEGGGAGTLDCGHAAEEKMILKK